MKVLDKTKKERNETIKFLLLVIGFILVSFSIQSSKAEPAKVPNSEFSQVLRIITLSNPKGQTERFTSDSNQLSEMLSAKSFSIHGIEISSDKSQCDNSTSNIQSTAKMIETELELSSVIKNLNDQLAPRRLLPTQIEMIKNVPLCQPYLADLKIIARLLDGWEIEKIEYL